MIPGAKHGKYYATVSDTDLTSVGELGTCAQVVVAGTAGSLVITLESGDAVTLDLAVGVPQYWSIRTFVASGTTAAKVTVGY